MKRSRIRLRFTGLWILFGPILACMWLAAINYANNLVYFILYLIASLSFISLFHAWRNLSAIVVDYVRVKPAFAGEEIEVEIFLRNGSSLSVYGLSFLHQDESSRWSRPQLLRLRGDKNVRLRGRDAHLVVAMLPFLPRGKYDFETLMMRSPYPFGLFLATFNVRLSIPYYVYPQAKGTVDWPPLQPSGAEGMSYNQSPGDDFAGLKTYVAGESLRHIDWKSYARGRPLSTKQFSGGEAKELKLDASNLSNQPVEEQLSQLALWIVNADKKEVPFTLKWEHTQLPLGLGEDHARLALEILAVAGIERDQT